MCLFATRLTLSCGFCLICDAPWCICSRKSSESLGGSGESSNPPVDLILLLDLLKKPRKNKKYSPKGTLVRPKIKNHLKQNQVLIFQESNGQSQLTPLSCHPRRLALENSAPPSPGSPAVPQQKRLATRSSWRATPWDFSWHPACASKN